MLCWLIVNSWMSGRRHSNSVKLFMCSQTSHLILHSLGFFSLRIHLLCCGVYRTPDSCSVTRELWRTHWATGPRQPCKTWSKDYLNDHESNNRADFFPVFSLLLAFLWLVFQPLISMHTGFQWLELGSLVDSTTDHFYLLLIQLGENLSTMCAEHF